MVLLQPGKNQKTETSLKMEMHIHTLGFQQRHFVREQILRIIKSFWQSCKKAAGVRGYHPRGKFTLSEVSEEGLMWNTQHQPRETNKW